MTEVTKIDRNYLEAFNLGYEMAKELDLKSPILNDIDLGTDYMKSIHDGMLQYNSENEQRLEQNISNKAVKDKDQGFNLSI